MILYHGSNMPVHTPEVRPSTRAMDFGAGFYCATNRTQAIEFAHKVVARSVKFGRAPGVAMVTVYEFDEAAAQGVLHTLRYEKPDSRWLNQVTEFRLCGDMSEGYDLIIGPVANDNVFPVLQAYWDDALDIETALSRLKIRRLYDQYCFKSATALSFLRCVDAFEAESGKGA